MKLTPAANEVLGKVIELAADGYSAGQIAKQVGKSASFIDRMLRNLPSLIGQHLAQVSA